MPPSPHLPESPSLAEGKPFWSREENGAANLVRSAGPAPGGEKVHLVSGNFNLWRRSLVLTLDCSFLGLHFKNSSIF